MSKFVTSIRKKINRLRNFPIIGKYNELNLILDPKDWIDNRVLSKVPYETKQISYMIDLSLKYNLDFFLDIGANIGLYSLNLAKQNSITEIHAFEPLLNKYNQLLANSALNNFSTKIHCHNFALGENQSEAEIYINPNSTGVSRLDLENSGRNNIVFTKKNKIKIVKYDDIFNFKNKKFLIKIDVEGHSIQVLNGLKEFLKHNKGCLQIELGIERTKATDLLSELGYELFHSFGDDVYYKNI